MMVCRKIRMKMPARSRWTFCVSQQRTCQHKMNRTPVDSSHIADVGYDPDAQVLEVGFANGQVYQYGGVPAASHQAFMAHPSKGGYLHKVIRKNHKATNIT